jgi:hypothetical protein
MTHNLESQLLLVGVSLAVVLTLVLGVLTARVVLQAKKMTVARDQILNYLESQGFTMMSFERIRKNVNESYSDQFLQKLPDYFPNQLRRARLKGNKLGLARIPQIIDENAEERSAE